MKKILFIIYLSFLGYINVATSQCQFVKIDGQALSENITAFVGSSVTVTGMGNGNLLIKLTPTVNPGPAINTVILPGQGMYNATIPLPGMVGEVYTIAASINGATCFPAGLQPGTITLIPMCVPTITCPSPPGVFDCGDDVGLNAWLNSFQSNNCGLTGTFVKSDYDPMDFPVCATTTNNITFALENAQGTELATCVVSLTINAAPTATITTPNFPTTITCDEAFMFNPGLATFTNGLTGACGIFGAIQPTLDETWDACNGGIIKVFYITQDACNRPLTALPITIDVDPAPQSILTTPNFPTNISCDMAFAFTAGPATYTNGVQGMNCGLSGTIPAVVEPTWDACNGGIIKVFYLAQDACNRPLTEVITINVDPTPPAVVTYPNFPTNISCDMAFAFTAAPATYTNGVQGMNCGLSGTINPVVEPTWDACNGGIIKAFYVGQDGCNNPITMVFTINVDPTPPPVVTYPTFPTSISCDMAFAFTAGPATYTNGVQGMNCGLSGTIPAVVEPTWDACNGGIIKVFYIDQDGCNNPITMVFTINVDPTPPAVVTFPTFPTTINCDMAFAFTAGSATYTNGVQGMNCGLSGTIPAVVEPTWDACNGGVIKVFYIGQDGCNNPITMVFTIIVEPTPPVVVSVPTFPTSISCSMASTFTAGPATYTNGVTSANCGVSGTIPAVVDPTWDACNGGIIKVFYIAQDACNRPITEIININVDPAPTPQLVVPNIPTTMSCEMATSFAPPAATYNNGLTGVCENSGTIPPMTVFNFDKCGGTITISYSGQDNCGRPLMAGPINITVEPAPLPTIALPTLPASVSCEMASTYFPPAGTYSNGLTGACGISGSATPHVNRQFYTACGGYLELIFTGTDECGRNINTVVTTLSVDPAPPPTATIPTVPATLTCAESMSYLPPNGSYTNGLTGPCEISGIIPGHMLRNVDPCLGGTITVIHGDGQDICGNPLPLSLQSTQTIQVLPASLPTIMLPDIQNVITCSEAINYNPGNAIFSNGETGFCANNGELTPTLSPLWEQCDGGFILINYIGMDNCGNQLEWGWFKVAVLPDTQAPVGECVNIDSTIYFMYNTPEPDGLEYFKDSIASHYSDDCGAIVVTVVGDTGYPVCNLEGKFERVYQMEVSDNCGNVSDTCLLTFSGICDPLFCTLAPEVYGNPEDSLFGLSTLEIIDSLLDFGNNPITIGTGECGYTIDDAACLQQIINGQGLSTYLPQIDLNCMSTINNTLANNLLALMLNVRYNNLINPNGPLDFGNYLLSATCKVFSPAILDAMPENPTINDLIAYGNNYLGCQCTGTCGEYEEVNWALTCALLGINSRYHNCHEPGPCTIKTNVESSYTQPVYDTLFGQSEHENILPTQFHIDDIRLYPNPVKEELNIQLMIEKSDIYELKILNINGQVVLTSKVNLNEGLNIESINMTHLENGMYLLMIDGKEINWSERFIKVSK